MPKTFPMDSPISFKAPMMPPNPLPESKSDITPPMKSPIALVAGSMNLVSTA